MEKTTLSRYEIFTRLMGIGKSMRLHCHKAIEVDGFTLNETDVLLSLASGDSSVKEISAKSSISKGNISAAVESLKKKGYVTSNISDKDRRYMTVSLTDAADAVMEKLRIAEEEFFSKFMISLPKKEAPLVERIFSSLQKFSLSAFLEKLSKKEK